jgi:hypothetical protein
MPGPLNLLCLLSGKSSNARHKRFREDDAVTNPWVSCWRGSSVGDAGGCLCLDLSFDCSVC